jgi:hypothetical protein
MIPLFNRSAVKYCDRSGFSMGQSRRRFDSPAENLASRQKYYCLSWSSPRKADRKRQPFNYKESKVAVSSILSGPAWSVRRQDYARLAKDNAKGSLAFSRGWGHASSL